MTTLYIFWKKIVNLNEANKSLGKYSLLKMTAVEIRQQIQEDQSPQK